MNDIETARWLKSKPAAVRRTYRRCPPGWYRIKPGAPYGVSCEGTLVSVFGYQNNGHVWVVVRAEHKLPAAIEHERMLAEKHGKPPIHTYDILVMINPVWMEPVAYDGGTDKQ